MHQIKKVEKVGLMPINIITKLKHKIFKLNVLKISSSKKI